MTGGLLALLLLAPGSAAGQEDDVRAGLTRPDTLVADTLPGDSAARDTVLTPRQRAIRQLRSMPRSPVQPDTTAADSLPADSTAADTAALDTLGIDTLGLGTDVLEGVVLDTVAPDSAVADSAVADSADDAARLVPEPPDTMGVERAEDRVRLPDADTGAAPSRPGRERDPGPVREADVREQIGALEGYVTTEYEGERAVFRSDSNQLEITGDSRIVREGSTLETDSLLVYDGEAGVVCGYGRPVLSGDGDPVESSRVCFDVERDVGMAEGARTRFTEQGTWYVQGADNEVYVLTGAAENTLYGRKTHFTSCDLEDPHYTFAARSLKMVEDEMMVARDVTLRFEDVPVFWLPWMVQSMKRGRRSGLLMPQFGVNDIVRNNAGYSRQISNIGFYWAINDHASARGTFEWYAGNWTAVEGALTYYWRRQFLRGNLTTKHYWREQEGAPAGRELTLNTSNSWQPDERTRLQLNANYASSTDFVQRNSFDPRELNRSIRSSASVNRTFDWGSMTLGADRRQQLSSEQVDMTLPSLRLSLSPVTIYENDEGFSVTWRGSGNATRNTKNVLEDSLAGVRDTEQLSGSASHSLSVGRLSLGQNVDYRKDIQGAKPAFEEGADSLALSEEVDERMSWGSSLGYQQTLWIGTTLTPSVSVNATRVRNDDSRLWTDSLGTGDPGSFVSGPLRVSAGASLNTAIYGFWPGVAGFSRIRHKITPSLRWSYSPAVGTTALQDSVFGSRNQREQNRLTLSFNQTFEAKVEADDTAAADSVELGQAGEPRRLPQTEKITLLALNTSTPFVYDFIAAREEGRGFQTTRINNSVRSDLVQGLQLRVTHELFDEGERPGDGGLAPRTFAPFLTDLNMSFSIDNEFWLLRFLGLTAEEEEPGEDADTTEVDEDERDVGAEGGAERPAGGVGAVVPGDDDRDMGMRGGTGRWQASISYALRRSRPTEGGTETESQLVRAGVSFSPTEHWSVRWNTAYSFTDNEFADHILTLTRDLHRWQANFDFTKARNGNFAFRFRVELQDNRDLKLDYDQRQRGDESLRAPGRPTGG